MISRQTAPRDWVFKGANVVLPDRMAEGADVFVESSRIADIGGARSVPGATEVDVRGCILLPGLIDLHSDAIEKAIEPRPRVFFPPSYAMAENDRLHLHSGITTVFNAVAIAGREFGLRDPETARRLIHDLKSGPGAPRRRLHLRYEISDTGSGPLVERLLRSGDIHLLSVMDHTPGQGQYAPPGSYKRYLMRTYTMTDAQARRLLEAKEKTTEPDGRTLDRILLTARQCGVPVAAHDLDQPPDAAAWRERGATICEFPLNLETAREARAQGLHTVIGAPNVVRGYSSGIGLRAIDAVAAGVADILCSDYAPPALLPALFRLAREGVCPLPTAIALATFRPAHACGLTDFGTITPGARADLLVVSPDEAAPRLEAVFINGHLQIATGPFAERIR